MRIDFYGDLTCPWCHLGWRRLHTALAQRAEKAGPGQPPHVIWRPYQLNPDIPVTGVERQDYMLRKFGNAERVREVQHAVETAMRADGIHVNLHRIKMTSNTYLGHRLMVKAQRRHKADVLLGEIFVAYFVQGHDIGDPAVLKQIALKAGLDERLVDAELARHDPDPDILASEQDARQLGIRAVPYVLFDGKYSIAGAHDPVAFMPLIDIGLLGVE